MIKVVVLVLLCAMFWPLEAQDRKKASGGGPTPPAKATDAVHDIVGQTFSSNPVENGDIPQQLDDDLGALVAGATIYWQDIASSSDKYKPGESLYHLATGYVPQQGPKSDVKNAKPACASIVAVGQTYIFHITHWTNNGADPQADNPSTLVSSNWYVYHHPRHWWGENKAGNDLVKADLTGTGDPLIYGASRALIVSIDRFDKFKEDESDESKSRSSARLSNTYSITVTQGTAANKSDAAALFSALTGISSGTSFMAAGGTETYRLYVGAACQAGPKDLPYDMAIADSSLQKPATDDKVSSPQAPSPGNVKCSGPGNTTPCAVNRTFTSVDKEYWDVGIGITIPGVRETKYTFATTTSTVTQTITRHTDLYALADLYPFGHFVPKESRVPHIVVGVPVTSQSLYRPYFGLGENLTGWRHLQKRFGLPVGINFIAGVTYMRTQFITGAPPTTQAEFNAALKTHRVWKGIVGLEVPVSSIASKLGGKGK